MEKSRHTYLTVFNQLLAAANINEEYGVVAFERILQLLNKSKSDHHKTMYSIPLIKCTSNRMTLDKTANDGVDDAKIKERAASLCSDAEVIL